MNKKLVISIALLTLLSLAVFVSAQTTCSDPEGSTDNYFSKNKITAQNQGGNASVIDSCLSDLPSIVTDTLVDGGIITASQLSNQNILIESYCPSSLPASLSDLRPFQKAYVCSNGCSDGACVECVVGLRQKGKYCSPEGIFEDQKEEKESCENNFECNSNLCINDECLSGSLWAKFIRWLSRIFG